MKLYNLTYDCNNPVVQQINVPTNTDYKLGVKVRRNGELVALKSSDVTLGTLSADANLENGYVTFTKAAGDEASYTKLDLDVDYEPLALSARGTATTIAKASLELSAYPSLVGKAVKASDFYSRAAHGASRTTPSADVIAEIEQKPFRSIFEYSMTLSNVIMTDVVERRKEGSVASDIVFSFPSLYIDTALRAGQQLTLYTVVNPEDIPPKGVPYGFEFVGKDGTKPVLKIATQYTLQDNDIVFCSTSSVPTRAFKCADVMVQLGQPFESKFKLLENIYKSQQGDIADGVESASTVNIAGTLADNTPFDFNAVIK